MRALFIALLAVGCGGSGTTDSPIDSIEEFEQRLEALRASSHIPAITAVIAKDQEIRWAVGLGQADIAGQRAAQDTTVYHLASLTKPFAATVLLQLVEEGKVSLDDPVSIQGRARHLALRTVDGELVAHHQGAGPGTDLHRAGQHR